MFMLNKKKYLNLNLIHFTLVTGFISFHCYGLVSYIPRIGIACNAKRISYN